MGVNINSAQIYARATIFMCTLFALATVIHPLSRDVKKTVVMFRVFGSAFISVPMIFYTFYLIWMSKKEVQNKIPQIKKKCSVLLKNALFLGITNLAL